MKKFNLVQRVLSILLCAALLVGYIPAIASAADDAQNFYNRIVDANTMNNWTKYFDLENLTTINAGGVWTDKSVFTDASAFGGKISMLDSKKNFLTALSALAANKEVVGYSTVPTDTVLVLDLSGSMEGAESSLVNAANNAIKTLLETNENNRVGVVLYSASSNVGTSTYTQSVTRILPIDRYTTDSDNVYLRLRNNIVSVDSDVRGTIANADLDNQKAFSGGTYIQAGLFEAMKMFREMDTVIADGNWQSGDDRMPILVLMSDGAPSTGTSNYTNVGTSNIGNGNEQNLTAGNIFLTQLTAAYVMGQIEAHYQQINPDVRGLFYTLGFNIGNNRGAQAVMNPDQSTLTDALWRSYLALGDKDTLLVNVKGTSGSNNNSRKDVTIYKNSYVTSKSYVDGFFSASGTGLTDAFQAIVEEIILQSRYYPTHLEGGNPDFSGYVTFTDDIGEYMEVKDIKGILLGDTLFDGRMMASKLADTGTGGLGTVENPTELGSEFIRAVKTRLGIADTATAQTLVASAFAAGQLKYNSNTDWSNYIGWYAKADGTYAGFWNENAATAVPANAVYKIKSYGFLGETHGSIKNSDMMHMSVQVRTNIATGMQTVLWNIPASLVPLITYEVSLEGTNVDEARNVQVQVQNAESISPIRLVFESGLRADLNELNITRIEESKHVAADGITRQFWTNRFDITAQDHDNHKVTLAEFTPAKENERFYYTFDSAVFKKSGTAYVLLEETEGTGGKLNAQGEYYHRRYIFTETSSAPIFVYEKMSSASIGEAKWKADYVTKTGETGAWVVPAGTPARELQMYNEQKVDEAATKSAHMVFYPYLTEQNDVFHVDMNLGNNGLLEVTPAQGIKLSKTVDIFETGTSDTFRFRITLKKADGTPYTGTLSSWITALDEVPLGKATEVAIPTTGIYTVQLSKDQTFWLTGIPTGATYTIEEVSENADYKIKSVHVNGISVGNIATGTVAAHFIDEVDFVNTTIGEGDLVITKQVVDVSGAVVNLSDDIIFTAEVTLTNGQGAPVSGTFESSDGTLVVPASGKFTVTLTEGESFVVRGIPEMTRYLVEEQNIPNGFTWNADRSNMSGTVDALANDQALIVNTYAPTGTDGADVTVLVNKAITGNRTEWLSGESYTFTLERLNVNRAATVIGTATISSQNATKSTLFDLSSESYTEASTYYYRVTEVAGTQGGVTYDTAECRFSVVVADSDMDGDLEIVAVNNEANTTVTGSYVVTANFNNVYQPTGSASVTVGVQKKMIGNHSLAGFQFVLLDSADVAEASEILRSTLTGANGLASFTLNYAANRATMEGAVFTYYLAEIDTNNPNISYDTAIYKVEVTVKDNGDGTITASAVITPPSGGALDAQGRAVFTNTYVPSASDFVTISGNKSISGERVLNADEFSFTISADSTTPDAPMPGVTVVNNDATGYFAFPAIEFKDIHKGNTYCYVVSEVGTNPIGGFTYDTATFKVYVSVTDNGDATLSAEVTKIEKIANSTTTVEEILFTNVYYASPVDVQLKGEKILTGKTMQDGEFTFRLTPVTAGAPMPASVTATNTAKGVIDFGKITYAKAGVYVYTLTEVNGGDDRYDYDASIYTITVTITDNSRGVLSARVAMEKNGIDASAIVFRNGFVPAAVTYDIYADFGGKKELTGRELNAGEFEFVLTNAINGQQIGESVKNDATGAFKFPAVSLTAPGIYHYKITEVLADEKGVHYDTSSYHVRLEVTQDDNGVLTVTDKQLHKGTVSKKEVGGVLTEVTEYQNITANGTILFNNIYTADPVYVTLEATKILEGRDLVDGEFKFDLHKTDVTYTYSDQTLVQDDVVLTLQSDGTGSVVFGAEKFESAGTYYYVVVEDEIDENGITTHKTPYKVEITVADDLNGSLVASLKVDGQEVTGSTASVIKFRNTYNVTPGTINLGGVKELKGRPLLAEEFTFNLYSAKLNGEGKWEKADLLEQVKNKADKTFAFAPRQAELGTTYVYFITEDNTNALATVTYDKAEYMVVVTTEDNGDGTMKVNYTYTKGAQSVESVQFVNTYKDPQDPPKTGDEMNIALWAGMMTVSGICLVATFATGMKRKESEAE